MDKKMRLQSVNGRTRKENLIFLFCSQSPFLSCYNPECSFWLEYLSSWLKVEANLNMMLYFCLWKHRKRSILESPIEGKFKWEHRNDLTSMNTAFFQDRKREIINCGIQNVLKLCGTTFRKENRNVICLLDLNFYITLNRSGKIHFQKPAAGQTFLCIYYASYHMIIPFGRNRLYYKCGRVLLELLKTAIKLYFKIPILLLSVHKVVYYSLTKCLQEFHFW